MSIMSSPPRCKKKEGGLCRPIFHVSAENCISFLDPLIESWDVDLATFGLEIVLNRRVAAGHVKRFEFVEREFDERVMEEQGLTEFLRGPCAQRHRDGRGDRAPQAPAVHRQAAYSALLLPGATELARPPAFSDPAGVGPPLATAGPARSLSRTCTYARYPHPHDSVVRPSRSVPNPRRPAHWGQRGGPPSLTRPVRASARFTCTGT